MKFTVREIAVIGVFAGLWGAVEISLGTFLHVVKAPFTGALMAAIGSFILLMARGAVPKPGTTFLIGFITALIKLLSVAGSKLVPSAGILTEALLIEIILSLLGPNMFAFCLGAALATASTVLQNYIGIVLVSGKNVSYFIESISYNFEKMGIAFKGFFAAFVALITAKIIVCVILGTIMGALAWKVSGRMAKTGSVR